MKELKDKEFDEIFKSRMIEELPEFEESSWLKMEQKLRKKDRAIFYRNAGIILLLLSFGIAFYLVSKQNTSKETEIVKQSTKPAQQVEEANGSLEKENSKEKPYKKEVQQYNLAQQQAQTGQQERTSEKTVDVALLKANQTNSPAQVIAAEKQQGSNANQAVGEQQQNMVAQQPVIAQNQVVDDNNEESTQKEKKAKVKRRIPISLAINVGPDFNSTTSLIGGKTSLAFGVAVGVGITKKISVQTGLNFGHKNYNANAYNYTFNNPNAVNTIEQVQAACKVLEIPFRASLNINETKKRRISLNAGLSSYLMLKEDYVYKYHPQLNRSDRFLQVKNENKHILSVVDLSVTYDVKLKAKNLALGVEPYVKIPLTGIGAGDVPLKSSGLSLKLSYDFNKNQ